MINLKKCPNCKTKNIEIIEEINADETRMGCNECSSSWINKIQQTELYVPKFRKATIVIEYFNDNDMQVLMDRALRHLEKSDEDHSDHDLTITVEHTNKVEK